MTQNDVANYLCITPQAVSKWERCECLPDISLIPELAKLFQIGVEDILNAGEPVKEQSYEELMQTLHSFIDENLFKKIIHDFQVISNISELQVPLDIFIFLNNQQKEQLLKVILEKDGYEFIIGDLLPYLNGNQKEQIIQKILDTNQYENLELMIPYMSRNTKQRVVEQLLKRKEYEMIEDMMPFLNKEQKDKIIQHFMKEDADREILLNYIAFFDRNQRKMIEELES